MITHRMATQQPPEQPVRFYKVIALTFLFLTIVLFGIVVFMTSKKANIVIMAKQDNQAVTFTFTLGPSAVTDLFGHITSTKFSWKQEFKPTGIGQIPGVAEGDVVIYNETNAPQPLVKTTRLLTSSGILFRLSSGVTVPANGKVSAQVYADQKGASGNVDPGDFTIPGLNPQKQKLIYAKSENPMTGGLTSVGVLSEDDLANAKADFEQKIKDVFMSSLPESDAQTSRVVSSSGLSTSVNHKVGETVTEFIISGTSTMMVVNYKTNDLKKLIDKQISGKYDSNSEKLLSVSNAARVTIDNVDLKTGIATIGASEILAVTLDENSPKLSPENFFGKSKDEIERYLLGINHVSGADVAFFPSWTMTAPSVAEKIQVKVVNVK